MARAFSLRAALPLVLLLLLTSSLPADGKRRHKRKRHPPKGLSPQKPPSPPQGGGGGGGSSPKGGSSPPKKSSPPPSPPPPQSPSPKQGGGGSSNNVAGGTFYGGFNAAGTWGGACGYGNLPASGYGIYVAAGSQPIFQQGQGCGSCYRIACTGSKYCKATSLVVPITDWCPGGDAGPCCDTCTHFDLSEPAFVQLADRAAGVINLSYTRVPCSFSGDIQLTATGSPFWLNLLVRRVAGPGDLALVEVLEDGSQTWKPLVHSWGANWAYHGFLQAPLQFRLTSRTDGLQVVSKRACLPAGWQQGQDYYCGMQFPMRVSNRGLLGHPFPWLDNSTVVDTGTAALRGAQ